jgi:hypothetical protein
MVLFDADASLSYNNDNNNNMGKIHEPYYP